MRHAIWLLLLLIPAASAEAGFQFATWSGSLDASAVSPIEAAGCSAEVRLVAPNAFTFEEGAQESGCGEVRMDVPLSGVAGSLEVAFDADRRISGPQVTARSMPQELRFEVGGRSTERSIFDAASGSQPAQRVAFRFDIPAGATSASVVWHFADEGLLGPLGAESLSSTVSDVSVRMERIPLEQLALREGGRYLDGDDIVTVHELQMQVPSGADAVTVVIDDWQPQGVVRPDGAFIPLSMLGLVQDDDRVQVLLPPEVLGEEGTYTMQATSRAPAPPPPSFAGGIHPAIWPLLGTPVLLGSVSMASAVKFYRQAPADRRHDGLRLVVQNGVVAAGYGILLTTAYLARSALGENPPGSSAFLLMAQLAVVSFAFLALWQLGARSMTNRLQSDLRRREREQAELERLNTELRRSNEDLARFAHIASHDLKEPLRSVQFHSERVMHKYGDLLDERGKKSLSLAAGGAARMRGLVDGLLSYATIERQLGPPSPVDLDAAVDEVISGLEPLIRERDAHVTRHPLPVVQGHRRLLQQAFQNLIVNAIKYGGRGGRVEIRAKRHGEGWRLEVEDDGPGIAPEYHAKVFEAFARLEGKSEEGGTGIGLAVVSRVAQLHGGRVGLESQPGHGCTFYLEFPAIQ